MSTCSNQGEGSLQGSSELIRPSKPDEGWQSLATANDTSLETQRSDGAAISVFPKTYENSCNPPTLNENWAYAG
jgi:hypothetical protein